jgi:hypothetical protein
MAMNSRLESILAGRSRSNPGAARGGTNVAKQAGEKQQREHRDQENNRVEHDQQRDRDAGARAIVPNLKSEI